MQKNVAIQALPHRPAAFYASVLLLLLIAGRASAQAGKVSPTGEYQASLSCGAGVADAPGPNGEQYTSAGVTAYDSTRKGPPGPSLTCGNSHAFGGSWAATMWWNIFVYDKTHTQVKQCGSDPYTPITGGRFACKASGNTWATLTIKPK